MAMEINGNAIGLAGVLIPIVGSIALFSFLAVATWSDARRRERETYYTTEALKKIAESSGEGAKSALEYLQEKNRESRRRRMEGMKLGGLICAGIGIGLMFFLHGVAHDEPVYLVGLMPLLVGVALSAYSFVLAPQE